MSDMIQINIQAILDKSSEAKILETINGIRNKINGDPLVLKVTTDSVALNALTSKIQTLTSEASKPIVINASGNISKITTTFGEDLKKFKTQAIETSTGVGDLTRSIQTLNTKTGEYANSKVLTQNLAQQQLATQKLIITQNELRSSMASLSSIAYIS